MVNISASSFGLLTWCLGRWPGFQHANRLPRVFQCKKEEEMWKTERRAARRRFATVSVYPFKSWWVLGPKCIQARGQKSPSKSKITQTIGIWHQCGNPMLFRLVLLRLHLTATSQGEEIQTFLLEDMVPDLQITKLLLSQWQLAKPTFILLW